MSEPPAQELVVRDQAIDELLVFVDAYNEARPGLGEELADLFFAKTMGVLQHSPFAFAVHPKEPTIRVYPLERFPLKIVYRVDDEAVVVIALSHQKAKPDLWRGRLIEPDESD